jgi:large subunit ribosomal protein L30
MAKIKITQVVSRIGSTARQKRNLDALGIKKMGRTVVHEDSPIILGMVEKVKHLVKVEAVEDAPKARKAAPKKAAPKAEAPAAEVAEPVKED